MMTLRVALTPGRSVEEMATDVVDTRLAALTRRLAFGKTPRVSLSRRAEADISLGLGLGSCRQPELPRTLCLSVGLSVRR